MLLTQSKPRAVACILLAIAFATGQDAVVKSVSSTLPAWEAVIFRTLVSAPLLLGWLAWSGRVRHMFKSHVGLLAARSAIICSAYFGFVLSIAAMPLATAVSIYFTMPFFVAGLSGRMLGERTPLFRWLAIVVGFAGVMVAVRPTPTSLEPGMFFAAYSAFGYAWSQMLGRRLSAYVAPVVVANWQNFTYLAAGLLIGLITSAGGFAGGGDKAIAFLIRPWMWPDFTQIQLLVLMGVLSAAAAAGFILAYSQAEANFVAPFEYSAIIWAILYGALFFGDFPDAWNIAGTALVIASGLFMLWKDTQLKARDSRSKP